MRSRCSSTTSRGSWRVSTPSSAPASSTTCSLLFPILVVCFLCRLCGELHPCIVCTASVPSPAYRPPSADEGITGVGWREGRGCARGPSERRAGAPLVSPFLRRALVSPGGRVCAKLVARLRSACAREPSDPPTLLSLSARGPALFASNVLTYTERNWRCLRSTRRRWRGSGAPLGSFSVDSSRSRQPFRERCSCLSKMRAPRHAVAFFRDGAGCPLHGRQAPPCAASDTAAHDLAAPRHLVITAASRTFVSPYTATLNTQHTHTCARVPPAGALLSTHAPPLPSPLHLPVRRCAESSFPYHTAPYLLSRTGARVTRQRRCPRSPSASPSAPRAAM